VIAPTVLGDVAAVARTAGAGAALEGALRERWPALRFTVCSDDDVPARLAPALEDGGFNLYFIGGGEHCLALTADPAAAIGVVVAWCEADEA